MAKGKAEGRKPLWRRINRHQLFALHVLAYAIGGIWIWTLRAPTLDKRFDVLLWLTVLAAHGLVVYARRRGAFFFHLLMFVAGNGAIWSTTAPVDQKLTVNLAWLVICGLIGVWLFRRAVRQGMIAPRARTREAAYEAPEFDESDEDEPVPKRRAGAKG